jgi:hypothetical protein
MEAMRESWTDRRLDDFAAHTDQRFDQVDKRFDQIDKCLDKADIDMRELRTEMNLRFDSMQRSLIQFGGVMIAALIGLIAAQIGLFVAMQL